jgi:hypothetical protein
MSDPSTRDVEIDEVLPPGKESAASSNPGDEVKNHTSKILAHWLDEFFRIPGTNFRIGLDPIIAFVPGVGDFFASSAGMIILLESARNGVSVSVLIRMGMNMLMNTVFDLIPGIGPFFSAFFKSNSRNLALLQQWQAGHQAAVRRSTWRMFAVVFVFFALLVALWIGWWVFILFYLAPNLGRAIWG